MPKQSEITKGFIKAVKNISGLPKKLWPNITADPKGEHLRFSILPVEPEPDSLGCDKWLGLVQVSIYTKKGTGLIKAHQYADLIIEAFPRRTQIVEGGTIITISKDAWASPHFVDGAFNHVPVTISYEV